MKNFTTILILLISSYGMAQIGVNTTTPNAMMEISSTTNGFLLPRVALAGTTVAAPVVNPQGGAILESTLVYNTATVAGVNGVSPGYYYWNGTRWITFTGNSSRDWSLEGNSGITTPTIPVTYGTSLIGATENFLGTKDANDVVFGTNGIERIRLKQSSGNVGIGTANPQYKLDILAPGNTIGLQILSGNAAQLSYLSLGRTYEYAQIGAATTGTFFTDAQNGDMAIKNFNTGKLLLGASYIDTADMSIIPGGNVGINTSSPGTLFDVRGINNWDTNATEGDVRIGDPTYRFKIGVATGGAGAGDVRLSAHGGTNRIFLGSATNNLVLTVDGLNNKVGIKSAILPNSVLDINGDLALKEGPALALPNSATPAATLTAGSEYSHYRVTGPTVPFSLQTISGGNDGQVLTLINTTGQIMSIANNNVANGILTGTGGNLTGLTTGNSTVTLVYNATLARWIVTSYSGLTNTRDWRLTGNAGITTPATPVTYGTSTIGATENYMGTTDANDVVFGTNNIERMRLKLGTGNVGIGLASPLQPLHVFKNFDNNKTTILGEARQISIGTDYENIGVMGYGRGGNATWGYGAGVMGIGDYINSWHATGVYAGLGTGAMFIPANTDQAFYADGGGLGYSGIFANGLVGIGNTAPNRAMLQTEGAVGNTVATFNLSANSLGMAMVSDWPGIYFNSYYSGGVRQMSSGNYPAMFNYNPGGQFEFSMNNTANSSAGNLTGGTFYNRFIIHRDNGAYFSYNNANIVALGAYSGGIAPDLGWFTYNGWGIAPQNGKGIASGGEYIGIEARANYVNTATYDKMGGLFYVSGYNGGPTWGCAAIAAVGSVVDNVAYKIVGYGTVSTLVQDENNKERVMVAPESPEALFQDYGIGKLINGYSKIDIDPILTKNIRVDETHPLKVFIQLEGDCNGVYVYNKTATSFEVKELQNGNSNASFSYQIVAYRADEERAGQISKYSDMRFKPLNREFKVSEKTIEIESVSDKNMTENNTNLVPKEKLR